MRCLALIFLIVPTAAFAPPPLKQPVTRPTSTDAFTRGALPVMIQRSLTRSSCLTAHAIDDLPAVLQTSEVQIFPAQKPLLSFVSHNSDDDTALAGKSNTQDQFSILSWNILLPNSQDNWWCHKMYASWVPMEKREWSHRQTLIQERLLLSGADVVCIQEADGDTFEKDFAFMKEAGYQYCLHKKFRFRCATFFKEDKFVLDQEGHKDRTLVTSLRSIGNNNADSTNSHILYVVNCHLSGGAAPERRLRQVYEALDQIRKWKAKVVLTLEKQRKANRPSPKNILKLEESLRLHEDAGVVVCGDFNSDGNTGVRQFLVEGSIDPEWREPQYPNVALTSKLKEHLLGGPFADAVELAYGANVCDGDYGEAPAFGCRPATYVVHNLASLLLLPIVGERIPRTQFGLQVARGLADTLGLDDFCENEMDRAFESIDLDGNNLVDEDEIQTLLESAYVATYGRQIEEERKKFFEGFRGSKADQAGLSREQLTEKLLDLQQELETRSGKAEFGQQMARGITDALGLHKFTEAEMSRAFESIDLDGNNLIDEDEVVTLLESVYVAIYRPQIVEERRKFFDGFTASATSETALSREQLTERLIALQQELEGGSEGSELVEVRTEADAQRMIDRFSPLLKSALDQVFENFSSDEGETLTEEEVAEFLMKTNGQVDRGGTSRHAAAVFNKKTEASKPAVLTRQDWYGIFARELGEGKWWQVVYDLEVCGATLRSPPVNGTGRHYQGWLDYMYFDSGQLTCVGVQEALTDDELCRIYNDGDALPNEWYPSDHLPVAALFSW
jgi:endonuclease/exonuclease/phosphatase family metal-dependent hydrolase/Ca2+-binding EF-hand superfamily protein